MQLDYTSRSSFFQFILKFKHLFHLNRFEFLASSTRNICTEQFYTTRVTILFWLKLKEYCKKKKSLRYFPKYTHPKFPRFYYKTQLLKFARSKIQSNFTVSEKSRSYQRIVSKFTSSNVSRYPPLKSRIFTANVRSTANHTSTP